MTALLIDPHGDDAVLFAAYTCLRERPHILLTHPTVPMDEIRLGAGVMGCTTWDSPYLLQPDKVYAPAAHPDGHFEHNEAAEIAQEFGVPITYYCTYAPRGERQKGATEVEWQPWMIAAKLRALACFVSQIEQPSTRPWFTSLLDLREWYA